VFAASYARRRSLEVDPVTFACRVAFFQDSTWFARMWEYSLAVETPCGLRASSGTGPRDCQSAITTWNRRTCGSEGSHHAPTGDATNRACQAGRTAEEHSVPNAHANVDRGVACEGGSQNSLGAETSRHTAFACWQISPLIKKRSPWMRPRRIHSVRYRARMIVCGVPILPALEMIAERSGAGRISFIRMNRAPRRSRTWVGTTVRQLLKSTDP
jgi:hypothetical protein